MSKTYPGVPTGTKIDPMTYDDDKRVEGLAEVTIEKPALRHMGAVWVGGIRVPSIVAAEVGIAATILGDYRAGNADRPTDADRLERLAAEIARQGADPRALRRAADLVEAEQGLTGGG